MTWAAFLPILVLLGLSVLELGPMYATDRRQAGYQGWLPVTCDVGYLSANLGLPRPLCSRVRPDVRDRQTDVRQATMVGYQSRVIWATSVPILVFLGFSVLDLGSSLLYLAQCLRDSLGCKQLHRHKFTYLFIYLGPIYMTERQTYVRQHHCLMPLPRGRGHNNS